MTMAQRIIHCHLHIYLMDEEREREKERKQIEFIEFLELCGFEFQLNLVCNAHSVKHTHETYYNKNERTNMQI